jgi:peroxiredoxin
MLEAGAYAPVVELKDTEGNQRSLEQMLATGPVLLAFFKISCPVCQMTAPFLSRLAKSESVQVVGVSQDDAAATKGFNQRFGVTFPVLIDEGRAGYPASNSYGITFPDRARQEDLNSLFGIFKGGYGYAGGSHGGTGVPSRRECPRLSSGLRLQELGPGRDLR